MNLLKSEYIGIFLGVLYGLFIRFCTDFSSYVENIFSVTFIFIVPAIIGVIPILFSQTNIYKSRKKMFFYPILTIIVYQFALLFTRLEDVVCVLIVGLPSIIIAGILGLIVGTIVKNRINSKKLYSIILLPLLLFPLENLLPEKEETFNVKTSIVINNQPEVIFPNLINVPTITESEYENGFYQLIGIPRPLKSIAFKENNQHFRIGKFTDKLELYEYITAIDQNKFVNFKIDLEKSILRDKPTDQHVLKGDYFKFENINYTITKINSKQSRLTLSCDYKLISRLNRYGDFWARSIIKDFETRLLKSLKLKLDSN
jgi:hypothetical protein